MAARIDWFARWRDLVVDRDAQAVRWRGQSAASEDFWDGDRAKFFGQLARDLPPTDPVFAHLKARLRPSDVVLDVGAGAGRYAVAIAPHVREVIAVDPSAGMLGVLDEIAADRGLTNIRTVRGSWPDAAEAVPAADIVLCAHAFYWARDIAAFLTALDAKARRSAFIVTRVEQMDRYLDPLFPELHGEPRSPEPIAIELLGALAQLGSYAELTTALGFGRTFGSVDEAVDNALGVLICDPTPNQRDRVRGYLEPRIVSRDGRLAYRDAVPLAGIVSWTKPTA